MTAVKNCHLQYPHTYECDECGSTVGCSSACTYSLHTYRGRYISTNAEFLRGWCSDFLVSCIKGTIWLVTSITHVQYICRGVGSWVVHWYRIYVDLQKTKISRNAWSCNSNRTLLVLEFKGDQDCSQALSPMQQHSIHGRYPGGGGGTAMWKGHGCSSRLGV